MEPRDVLTAEMRACLADLEAARDQARVFLDALTRFEDRVSLAIRDNEDWQTRHDPVDAPRELLAALNRIDASGLRFAALAEALAALKTGKEHATNALLAGVNLGRMERAS